MNDFKLQLNFEIAERLRYARTCAKLTVAQLAERTNGAISASTLGKCEQGNRRLGIEEARILANALGTVTPAFLLCVEPLMSLAPDEIDLLGMYRATDACGRVRIRETAMMEVQRAKVADDG